jgi:hypothetical protein
MRILHAALCAGVFSGVLVAGTPAAAQSFKPAVVTTNISPLESLWHMRAALNVAALGCRDADEGTTVAAYNQLIRNQGAALAAANDAVSARYKAQYGTGWQDARERDMTRLYNYFAQPTAQAGFCATAKAVLAQLATVEPGKLTDFAVEELPALEAPFWSPADTPVAEELAPNAVVAIAAAVPVAPSSF